MKITLSTDDDRVVEIDVDSSCDMMTLRMIVASALKVSPTGFLMFHDGTDITSASGTLASCNVAEYDLISITQTGEAAGASSASSSSSSSSAASAAAAPTRKRQLHISDIDLSVSPEKLLELVAENPQLLTQFKRADTEIGNALAAKDIPALRLVLMKRSMEAHRKGWEKKQEMDRLYANPEDPENQKRIMQIIEQEQINQNHEMAMEEMPEAFARVCMLYVPIKINGYAIKAFVDSGAQSTIMSVRCAEQSGIMRLVDKRFAGEARGVGSAKIMGRVHMAQMQLGDTFLPVSLTVLENDDVDFLLGLDMLKRHMMEISLRDNALRFEGHSGMQVVPFLGEADLPVTARGTLPDELFESPKAGRGGASASLMDESDDGGAGAGGQNGSVGHSLSSTSQPSASSVASLVASAASSASHAPSSSSVSSAASVSVDPAKVETLKALGFSDSRARAALRQSDGDVDLAANLLWAEA